MTVGGAVGLLVGEALLALGAVVLSLFLNRGLNVWLELAVGVLLAAAAVLTWLARRAGWWLGVALQAGLSVEALAHQSLGVVFSAAGLALLLVPATRRFVFKAPGNMLDQ